MNYRILLILLADSLETDQLLNLLPPPSKRDLFLGCAGGFAALGTTSTLKSQFVSELEAKLGAYGCSACADGELFALQLGADQALLRLPFNRLLVLDPRATDSGQLKPQLVQLVQLVSSVLTTLSPDASIMIVTDKYLTPELEDGITGRLDREPQFASAAHAPDKLRTFFTTA